MKIIATLNTLSPSLTPRTLKQLILIVEAMLAMTEYPLVTEHLVREDVKKSAPKAIQAKIKTAAKPKGKKLSEPVVYQVQVWQCVVHNKI